jgi:hypothetical protein
VHALDLTVTVDGDLRDESGAVVRAIGWALDVALDHRYVLFG